MPESNAERSPSFLVLGWTTDEAGNPIYWQSEEARPGGYADSHLFRVKAEDIGCHTAIIAQSGAGKSFFLGRLIEEILLRTRARCVVLDPNADFRRVDQVEAESLWTDPNWKGTSKQKRFTHEASRDVFSDPWREKKIRILMGRGGSKGSRELLQLWWPRIPALLLSRDLNPVDRNDFHYCHRVLNLLGDLLDLRSMVHVDGINLEQEAIKLFVTARNRSKDRIRAYIDRRYGMEALASKGSSEVTDEKSGEPAPGGILPTGVEKMATRLNEMAFGIKKYVSPSVERFYFGKMREYSSSGILQKHAQSPGRRMVRNFRLEVVDLPSLDETIRIEAVGALIKSEWARARELWERALRLASRSQNGELPSPDTRVPTFIIVDEAHNLIPAKADEKGQEALREDFRRIVAEGRKFGLFLIFVSQRPDKLDPLVFSECDNKVVMRLTSKQVLESTRKLMGLEELPAGRLERCREFGPGRALMIGKWARSMDGDIIYAAASRTVGGGGNLNENHWAVPDAGSA